MGIGILVNGLIVGALAKLLIETDDSRLCARIYGGYIAGITVLSYVQGRIGILLGLAFGVPMIVAGYLFFGILRRVNPVSLRWWMILLGFIVAPVVVGELLRRI